MSKYFTKEVAGNIKRAKYQVKNAEGKYEVVYLETAADQVEETHDRVFVTPEQKAQITSNKEAIEAEKSAREEAVEGLSDRLEVIEGEGEGSVKKALQDAKSYTDGKVSEINSNHQELSEKVSANETAIEELNSKVDSAVEGLEGEISRVESAYKAADTTIKGRLDSLESETADLGKIRTDIAANTDAINKEVTDREAAVKAVDNKLTTEVSRATAAEVALGKRIDGVESDLTSGLNNTKEYVDGKVSEINANHNKLAERVTTNEGQLATVDTRISAAKTEAINSSKSYTDGEIVKLDTALKAADVQVLSDAKAYTDAQVLSSKTALETKIDEEVKTINDSIDALDGRVSTNESDIANLKTAISNKNNNTIVVNTEAEIATENPNPKEGDLAYVISSKRAYIYKGVNAIAVRNVPTGWVVFDEITSELDLKDYLKSADAASTYRRLDTAIVEGDLHSDLSTKINNKADKSYVNEELAKKADITYVDGQISTVTGLVNNNKTAIENEVSAREAAIQVVNTAIATETTNRTQAISTVTTAVNTEVSERKEAINTVTASITKEVSDREAAITGVETKLNNEVKDIETAMSNETTRVNALIETLNSKIAQADALIATLQGKLTTLEEIETNRIVFDQE